MIENNELVNEIKNKVKSISKWKTEKQKKYLMDFIESQRSNLNTLMFEEKRSVLHSAINLNKKSLINLLAKEMNVTLSDEKLKMWRVLEDCHDNSYKLSIIEKQKNWSEIFEDQYFFEQVFRAGRFFYINKKEKEFAQKLKSLIVKKTDVSYWLSKEEKTGLSKLSYILQKTYVVGDFNIDLIDIKPGWLGEDYYNIVSHSKTITSEESFKINEDKIDWNRIIKNDEDYPEEAKKVIRTILDHLWLQRTSDGKYIFEADKVTVSLLNNMWLFREKHFQYGLFTTEEKVKLLEKIINDKNNVLLNLHSKTKEGEFLRTVVDSCIEDQEIKWHKIEFKKETWKVLEQIGNDKFFHNLIMKSQLEENFIPKNQANKKNKI